MKLAKSLNEFIVDKKRIWLYGMGDWGHRLKIVLKYYDISIVGFLVTNDEKIICHLAKSVISFDEGVSKEDGVILATSNIGYIESMKKMLHDKGVLSQNIFNPFEHEDVTDMLFDYWYKYVLRKESKKRKKRDIFDYQYLTRAISFWGMYPSEKNRFFYSNFSYGQNNIVRRKYPFLKKKILDCTVLHAVYFFPKFTEMEINPPGNSIFCMSDYVFGKFKKTVSANVYGIGNYIKHVKPLLSSKKIKRLKAIYGKTLLVAPVHGNYNGRKVFDYEVWLKYIEEFSQRHGFEKIIICLGPGSVANGDHKNYSHGKYKIFSAGDPCDMFYLNRLKSVILMSDMVLSNEYNITIMGYALGCNVPFSYYDMKTEHLKDGIKEAVQVGIQEMDDIDSIYEGFDQLRTKVNSLFGGDREKITIEQRDFVKKYWGK